MKTFNDFQRSFLMFVSLAIVFSFMLFLGGCGGGGGDVGTTKQATGVFLDSPVSGLEYITDDLGGVTDTDGSFFYNGGSAVEFYVGDIYLGAATGVKIMTPVSLSNGAEDETDPIVTNICRFLQTLDDDGNATNGIQITQMVRDFAAGMDINFNQSVSEFESGSLLQQTIRDLTHQTAAGERTLVSASQAREHMRNTLIALYSGSYQGTFSGGDTGTWEIVVNSAGYINGSLFSNEDSTYYSVNGTIDSSGDFGMVAGTTTSGATFRGTTDFLTGNISGTWVNSYWGISGSFSGSRGN